MVSPANVITTVNINTNKNVEKIKTNQNNLVVWSWAKKKPQTFRKYKH
jgi:hypothetical protein